MHQLAEDKSCPAVDVETQVPEEAEVKKEKVTKALSWIRELYSAKQRPSWGTTKMKGSNPKREEDKCDSRVQNII